MEVINQLQQVWAWIQLHGTDILVALLLISEGLAYVPQIKANSVFQAVVNGLKWLKAKLPAPKA